MVKKLTKHGNSLALVVDRPILDLLKIDPDTLLDISTDAPSAPDCWADSKEREVAGATAEIPDQDQFIVVQHRFQVPAIRSEIACEIFLNAWH